jgi:protein involved in polysaccharide export with SLBB domain
MVPLGIAVVDGSDRRRAHRAAVTLPLSRFVVGLALMLAACAPSGPKLAGLAPGGAIVEGGVPIAPEHTLSAGDQFEIRLPFAADYNDRLTVGMDGTVAPKGIGSVQVGGLTVAEAAARLKERYAKLLKGPELSITMRRFEPELVYVDGWVAKPGLIRSEVPLTVARALAQAGGMKTGAKTGAILILRHDSDGGVHPYEVALGSYAGAGAEDPLLKSFDVVYVPQSPIAAVADFAKQYYANVPFSASFHIPPTRAPTIIVPQAVAPAPAPATVTPR